MSDVDIDVVVVRVYVTEGADALERVLALLHDDTDVMGMTMFRGVMGYGEDHEVRKATLLDFNIDLPMVVEFFDTPARADVIIDRLRPLVREGHLLHWHARANGRPPAP